MEYIVKSGNGYLMYFDENGMPLMSSTKEEAKLFYMVEAEDALWTLEKLGIEGCIMIGVK